VKRAAFTLVICAAALTGTACSGAPSGSPPPATTTTTRAFFNSSSGSSPIEHVVLIIQENRTFNNLFATFPGATGTTVGEKRVGNKTESIDLKEGNLYVKTVLNHSYQAFLTAYDSGKMDGFNEVHSPRGRPENTGPYQYVNPSQITPYWKLAQEYGLANAMFTTQGSDSFPAHQDLIRGGTEISAGASLSTIRRTPTACGDAILRPGPRPRS
jgi:phospholipase C